MSAIESYKDVGPSGMTTKQVVADLQANNPDRIFRVNPAGNVIGVDTGEHGTVAIYSLTCLDTWVRINGLPLINGRPAVERWIPA